MNISLWSLFPYQHNPSSSGSTVTVDKLKDKGNAHTAPRLLIHLNKSYEFKVFCTMHCDIPIVQHEPTKHTLFKLISPQETHTRTNTSENNPM
jgi:hypothetical protein